MSDRETITRLRPALVDDGHGNTVEDWDNPDELEIPGCLIAPGNTTETQITGDIVTHGFTVYAPPAVDVEATDSILLRGDRYDVAGEPAGWQAGTVIVLTRTEG